MYGFGLIGPDSGFWQQMALADPASQFRPGRNVNTDQPVSTPNTPAPVPTGPAQLPDRWGKNFFANFGQYQPPYNASALWQQAMQDPMSQFRAGRVGVKGYGTFTPPGVGGSAGQAAAQPMPQLGNFYTPYSPGDAQNLPTSTIGSNFLGEYATRRRE